MSDTMTLIEEFEENLKKNQPVENNPEFLKRCRTLCQMDELCDEFFPGYTPQDVDISSHYGLTLVLIEIITKKRGSKKLLSYTKGGNIYIDINEDDNKVYFHYDDCDDSCFSPLFEFEWDGTEKDFKHKVQKAINQLK